MKNNIYYYLNDVDVNIDEYQKRTMPKSRKRMLKKKLLKRNSNNKYLIVAGIALLLLTATFATDTGRSFVVNAQAMVYRIFTINGIDTEPYVATLDKDANIEKNRSYVPREEKETVIIDLDYTFEIDGTVFNIEKAEINDNSGTNLYYNWQYEKGAEKSDYPDFTLEGIDNTGRKIITANPKGWGKGYGDGQIHIVYKDEDTYANVVATDELKQITLVPIIDKNEAAGEEFTIDLTMGTIKSQPKQAIADGIGVRIEDVILNGEEMLVTFEIINDSDYKYISFKEKIFINGKEWSIMERKSGTDDTAPGLLKRGSSGTDTYRKYWIPELKDLTGDIDIKFVYYNPYTHVDDEMVMLAEEGKEWVIEATANGDNIRENTKIIEINKTFELEKDFFTTLNSIKFTPVNVIIDHTHKFTPTTEDRDYPELYIDGYDNLGNKIDCLSGAGTYRSMEGKGKGSLPIFDVNQETVAGYGGINSEATELYLTIYEGYHNKTKIGELTISLD